ncbi:MAG: hypothetical protein ABEI74_04815 [Candidatus Pacearchaeota archaeon]
MEILKVRENKNGAKEVTIPKKSEIKGGDYVKVTKLEEKEVQHGE